MCYPISLGLVLLLIVYISIEIMFLLNIYNKVTDRASIYNQKPDVLDVYQLKFNSYLKDFNKRYYGEEYERRFENFKSSLKDIARLNELEGNTVFGLTKFSDMSKQEFAERMLLKPGTISSCQPKTRSCNALDHDVSLIRYGDELPSTFDWRKKGVVKPVLNQKLCLGCWAFSIVGVMESMAAIGRLDNEDRSIQELLDCSTYNNGCYGGSVNIAMDYLCNSHLNITTEDEYPLTLVNGICRVPDNGRMLKEFAFQCDLNETIIVHQVYTHGPLIAAVDASNWLNYIGGVIRRACSNGSSNHVIQIVGYHGYGNDSDTSIPYYILRNSYGEDFGEQGYVKVAIGENVCGIADQVTIIDVV